MLEAGVIHAAENLSNHSAIYCKIEVGKIDESTEEVKISPKPGWAKASEEDIANYKSDPEYQLGNVTVPDCINCRNPLM